MLKSIIIGTLIVYIFVSVYIYLGFRTIDLAIEILEKDSIFFKYNELNHYKIIAILCTTLWPILIIPIIILGLIGYFKDK